MLLEYTCMTELRLHYQSIYFLMKCLEGLVESLLEHVKAVMRRVVTDSMDVAKVLTKRKVTALCVLVEDAFHSIV